jgi:uncharacterized protein YceK
MKIRNVLPIALLLAGCDSMVQMNAQTNAARVQVAALQSQAVVGAEWARTQAAVSVAQANAMSEVATNAAWASQLPWVVMAVCVTVIVVAYIWYRSRVAYAPSYPHAQVLPPPPPAARVLPTPAERQAALEFAHQHGGQLVETPDGRLLMQIDGQRRPLRITAK